MLRGLAPAETFVAIERQVWAAIARHHDDGFAVTAQLLLMGAALAASLSEAERIVLAQRLRVLEKRHCCRRCGPAALSDQCRGAPTRRDNSGPGLATDRFIGAIDDQLSTFQAQV